MKVEMEVLEAGKPAIGGAAADEARIVIERVDLLDDSIGGERTFTTLRKPHLDVRRVRGVASHGMALRAGRAGRKVGEAVVPVMSEKGAHTGDPGGRSRSDSGLAEQRAEDEVFDADIVHARAEAVLRIDARRAVGEASGARASRAPLRHAIGMIDAALTVGCQGHADVAGARQSRLALVALAGFPRAERLRAGGHGGIAVESLVADAARRRRDRPGRGHA